MKTQIATTSQTYSKIATLVMSGIDSWIEAGKLIVELVDNGTPISDIADECKIPSFCIAKLEQVGRNKCLPELLLGTYPAAAPIAKLTIEAQKQAIKKGVEVLIEGGQVLYVKADNLTPLQCKQVFDSQQLRTPESQRAWIESEKTRAVILQAPEARGAYEIRSSKIIIHHPCTLTRKDLHRMLTEIED